MFEVNGSCAWTKLYQKNGDVALVAKAYNGRVVMQWLTETIAALVERNIPGADDRSGPVALCMLLVTKRGDNLYY